MTPQDVIQFWAGEVGEKRWFNPDAQLDSEIERRFGEIYALARDGKLSDWQNTPDGALALLLLLDQFPRNMFRGDARTYAADPLARAVADRAIAGAFDQRFPPAERRFFYLPFEHSENLADQEWCVALNRAAGDEEGVKYAEIHADIIRRFGRFPHRNRVLGRATTAEEQAFLDGGGFAG